MVKLQGKSFFESKIEWNACRETASLVIKKTEKKKEKRNTIYWLHFFRSLLVPHMQTAHRQRLPLVQGLSSTKIPCSRRLELYNLFKNQGLQNLTFVFVTKPNQTESLSLLYVSTVQISGRIVCSQPSKPRETSLAADQYIGRLFQRTAPEKLFFLTFVWSRGIASLLLVPLKKQY